jgi:alkylated DNA repair protein alkB family protein 1
MPHPGEVGSAAYKKAWKQHRRSAKTPASEDLPHIRCQEKYFKAKFPPPSLERVLDLATRFSDQNQETDGGLWKGSPVAANVEEISCLQAKNGQTPPRQAFHLVDLPGEYLQLELIHGTSPTS